MNGPEDTPMFHANPLISASISVAFAAGVAGVFTLATAASSGDQKEPHIVRTVKADQFSPVLGQTDTNSIFFSSQPLADSGRTLDAPAEPSVKLRGVVSEQLSPEQMKSNRENDPMMNGCESGLSPDISPTVPMQPGRCIAEQGSSAKYASIR
jgi:hypothetical protein